MPTCRVLLVGSHGCCTRWDDARIVSRRHLVRIALVVAAPLAATLAVCTAAGAVSLPPQVVARLEADRDTAKAQLAGERATLAKLVAADDVAGARAAQLERDHDVATAMFAAFFDAPASEQLERLGTESATASKRADATRERLDDATQTAARAQGNLLDADRRLRALQRAAATEDERDAGIGSFRFGSGGTSVSAETIDRYLESKASPMAGSGADFLEAGIEHEIDPRLLVAIAGAESYFGLTTCAPYNGWGWGCPNGPFAFKSWGHGAQTVAAGLREGYLDDGLTTVGEIHLRYAPPAAANDPTGLNYAWADNVARFLVEQGGDPQNIAGVVKSSR